MADELRWQRRGVGARRPAQHEAERLEGSSTHQPGPTSVACLLRSSLQILVLLDAGAMLTTETTAGERFARAFLAKDWDGVATLLDPQVDFRGLTPGRAWEASTAEDLIQQVLSKWIEPSDDVHEVIDVATDRIADRWRVAYRFRVRNPGGDFVCEQTAYYDTDGERIIKLRVLCSGFLPAADRG